MSEGKVKWFNEEKGCGFIQDDEGCTFISFINSTPIRRSFFMELGTVIFFNNETGFGVIQDEEGKKVFLHYSEIRSESKNLYEGQRVCFDVRKGLRDRMALNIRLR